MGSPRVPVGVLSPGVRVFGGNATDVTVVGGGYASSKEKGGSLGVFTREENNAYMLVLYLLGSISPSTGF